MPHVDWHTAYDKQMDLWGWWHTPQSATMARGYMESVVKRGHGTEMETAALVRGQREIMLRADPIVVDDDMMTLIESAAATFPPEALRAEDLLTPVGFVWLPRPFRVLDINQKYMTIRAFAWGPVTFRVGTSEEWGGKEREGALVEGLMLSYYSWLGDAGQDDFGPDLHLYSKAYGVDMSMAHWEPWFYGDSYVPVPNSPGRDQYTFRFVQTMWRLMQQTITTRTHQQPQRAARRRAAKAGMPDKAVTVITLRRPRREPEAGREPTSVEWDHRWLVSGHWRNQWFPSLGPASDPAAHRSIWIHPYVKGPEDRPLHVRKLRVFEFVQ